ncbi:hypothetical protein J3F84DRAFT_369348 [Trichoderma pleuroticola]
MLEEVSINAKTSGKKHTVVAHAPQSLWKVWIYWSVNKANDQNLASTRFLFKNDASPDITNDDRDTSLHSFAKHNNREAIEMLVIQYQAGVNHLVSAGNTPLIWAIEYDDIDMVKIHLQSPLLNLNMWKFIVRRPSIEPYRKVNLRSQSYC